ncbi:helix-turn-helix transcriptional regulator [Leisingera sp. ANG-Vp]|uniref:helix-turn-helix transcriptional regulator n=1 Tax=Leisingera sp. ANG-Vp TaxID=1577896 RepID=UPI00057F88C5|nr:helix-turn-helix transcriptional regulator [Leisingera sp. ANG-Vp]KIC22610.1 XRE family transcriptional regulator [Leisingera sp. ANG-Vp]
MAAEFGSALKKWRQVRRMSQMELALSAGVSPRHVSFLETGRSRPSRGMVLRLCDELQLPGAARNQLLSSAGLAPAYTARPLDDAALQPLHQAVDWMLSAHMPYPAMAVDRHWRLQKLNPASRLLFAATGVGAGDSLIEALLENERLRAALDNLEEVEQHALARLRTEIAHFGEDPVLARAAARLQENTAEAGGVHGFELPAVIPARYRMNGQTLAFFSTITQFGGTGDLAMSELKIEMLFPADEATGQAMAALAGQ